MRPKPENRKRNSAKVLLTNQRETSMTKW